MFTVAGPISYSIQYSDIVKTEFNSGNEKYRKYKAGYLTKTGAALREGYKRIRSKRFGARSGTTRVISVMIHDS